VAGHADGPYEEARLRHPHGMALVGETLYVADTGTHTIRAADLNAKMVRTVAGTGSLGRGATAGTPGASVPLRSPWDLAWDGRRLYVAMAGAHQIWAYDPGAERIGVFAGTGREIHRDGPAESACFAQPSGLALLDGALYVADSEISTVRVIHDLDGRPEAGTVCGSRELFGFGDRDGAGSEVLLQHPIGIAADSGVLYVADTYNHKVKRVDPATGECRTLFGNGEAERLPELVPGYDLAPAGPEVPCLFEPEGLAVRDGSLLVADTNNHRVLAIDLATGVRRALIGG
jgi:DNA-binding beta-propeller fold protein YncE